MLGLGPGSDRVLAFREKDAVDVGLINGGLFICEPGVYSVINGDATVWEQEPMNRLVAAGALAAYRHGGFWQAMDTEPDKQVLKMAYVKRALAQQDSLMKFHLTTLKDAMLIEGERRGDDLGFFARTFCVDEFAAHGLPTEFVQQNTSYAANKGTLPGMHVQRMPHAEDKLIHCLRGAIVDIIIDLRPDSPTFRQWEAFEVNDENKRLLLVPKGFAHGFQTLSDDVEVTYLVSARYTPAAEGGVRWNDPAFGIAWPMPPTEISGKDQSWLDFTGSTAQSASISVTRSAMASELVRPGDSIPSR